MAPISAYRAKQEFYKQQKHRLARIDDRLALTHGASFLLILILCWFSIAEDTISPLWPVLFTVLFCGLMINHAALVKRLKDCKLAISYYGKRLDLLSENWLGQGRSGKRYIDDSHPYSSDLEVFKSLYVPLALVILGFRMLFEILLTLLA